MIYRVSTKTVVGAEGISHTGTTSRIPRLLVVLVPGQSIFLILVAEAKKYGYLKNYT